MGHLGRTREEFRNASDQFIEVDHFEVSLPVHHCVPTVLESKLLEIFDEQGLSCGQHLGVLFLEGLCPSCPSERLKTNGSSLRCQCCGASFVTFRRPGRLDVVFEPGDEEADECHCDTEATSAGVEVHFWSRDL
jgi:hypothetical protein